MNILLLGAEGQLGRELARQLSLVGTLQACTRSDVDLCHAQNIKAAIDRHKPDIIVNSAAYTAVDRAETEKNLAYQINAEAVSVLARQAVSLGIPLIHYSTDYVFDGQKSGAYIETDIPHPISVYGASKRAGEEEIEASGASHLIFRTTWVIGRDGDNFAKTILRLAQSRDYLNIVSDQIGVPTSSYLIAKVTSLAIKAAKDGFSWPSGIYHLVPQGKTSWYGIATALMDLARLRRLKISLSEEGLHPILTKDYPTPAKRPLNSRFDTSKLATRLNFTLPDWQDDFLDVAEQIIKDMHAS